MTYNNKDYINYERQVMMFEVGDIVQPIERKNAGWHLRNYSVLSMKADYRITDIRPAKRGHQLLSLVAVTELTPKHLDGRAFSGYDARNFKLIRKGNGNVNVTGQAKKTAQWIIVDENTGSIVGSIPLTDAPSSNEVLGEKLNLFVADPVRGTADFLNRFGDPTRVQPSAASYTEKLVDDKIAELLRKNPEGSYMAFKHVKTGQFPILPVQWTTA